MLHAQGPKEFPYVRLGEDYVQSVCWFNNPGNLGLETYFNPMAPSLQKDFNLKSLKPVLQENEGSYRFLLKYEKDRFYVWDEDGLIF